MRVFWSERALEWPLWTARPVPCSKNAATFRMQNRKKLRRSFSQPFRPQDGTGIFFRSLPLAVRISKAALLLRQAPQGASVLRWLCGPRRERIEVLDFFFLPTISRFLTPFLERTSIEHSVLPGTSKLPRRCAGGSIETAL